LAGHGYAVFSEVHEGIAADHRVFFGAPGPGGTEDGDIESKLLDVMLYCESCAHGLFTKKVWEEAKPLRVDMAPEDADDATGREARSEVIDFSIALRAKHRGLTPSEARGDARELGRLWWARAAQQSMSKIPRLRYGKCVFCGPVRLVDLRFAMSNRFAASRSSEHSHTPASMFQMPTGSTSWIA